MSLPVFWFFLSHPAPARAFSKAVLCLFGGKCGDGKRQRAQKRCCNNTHTQN